MNIIWRNYYREDSGRRLVFLREGNIFATKLMMLLLIVLLMACSKQLESGKLIHEEQTAPSSQRVGGSTVDLD
ncbi:hypothetical protein [Aeribacillus pallidus]|uniref:hypothetical protein n=1 Tax=Aeribacillus pallidus TaxID=33936 RepID=UPI003D22959A